MELLWLFSLIVLVDCCYCQELGRGKNCILIANYGTQKEGFSLQQSRFEVREILNRLFQDITIGFFSHSTALKSRQLSSRNSTTCQIIGVIGEIDSTTADIVLTLANRLNLTLTVVTGSVPLTSITPDFLDMDPFEHYIDAFVSFAEIVNWTRIGLISDNVNFNMLAAELLQKKLLQNPERVIAPSLQVSKPSSIGSKLMEFGEYGTQIIVIIAEKELECSILSEAKRNNYKWPRYALIVFEFGPHSLPISCYFDGVLVISNSKFSKNNGNAGFIQDAIAAVILAQQQNLFNSSFVGVTGVVKFRENKVLTNISIEQFGESNIRELATYNSETQGLVNVSNTLLEPGRIPHGSNFIFGIEDHPAVRITLVVLVFTVCTAFVTINLVLYICFRKEPEIKTSSVSVSTCMFIACYLLLIFLPVEVYETQPINHSQLGGRILCNFLAWISIVGVPFSLIFSTLFVKMLRVYAIFFKPYSYKKKLFSDGALLIYTLLLLSPNVFHLVLWAILDIFQKTTLTFPEKKGTRVFYLCDSRHAIVWLTVPMIYYMALVSALCILAVKTSKIRYKYFSNAHATNLFSCLSVLIFTLSILYYHLFIILGLLIEGSYALYIGHVAAALLCQFILFVPKILPPTKRFLQRRHNPPIVSMNSTLN